MGGPMIARLAAASLLALAAATPALAAEKGQPPITAQTASSGGPPTPEQKAVRFDTADLSFEVFPDREAIAGVATLDFTAKAPVSSLVIDLDRHLPVSAIAIEIGRAALRERVWKYLEITGVPGT